MRNAHPNQLRCLTLSDVNECDTQNPCQHHCYNLIGSYMCQCNQGYELAPDLISCQGKRHTSHTCSATSFSQRFGKIGVSGWNFRMNVKFDRLSLFCVSLLFAWLAALLQGAEWQNSQQINSSRKLAMQFLFIKKTNKPTKKNTQKLTLHKFLCIMTSLCTLLFSVQTLTNATSPATYVSTNASTVREVTRVSAQTDTSCRATGCVKVLQRRLSVSLCQYSLNHFFAPLTIFT